MSNAIERTRENLDISNITMHGLRRTAGPRMSRLGVLLKDDPVRGTAPPAACDGVTYFPSSLDPDPSGFIGGIQAGYNWQAGAIVIGLEIDLSHSSLDVRDSAIRIDSGPLPFRTSLDTHIEWFSTVRGRVGFLPLRGMMVFATGGLAFGETEQTLKWANLNPFGAGGPIIGPNNGSQLVCPAAGDCLAGSNSESRLAGQAEAASSLPSATSSLSRASTCLSTLAVQR